MTAFCEPPMRTSMPQPVCCHVEVRGAEAGDAVDDEQGLAAVLLEEVDDALDIFVANARSRIRWPERRRRGSRA